MELIYKSGSPEALWKPALYPVYLFFGEEDRMKEEAAAALRKYVVSEDFADFDLETLDASDTGATGILAAASQIPFGSERRMVLVKGVEQWRERGKTAEAETLAEGLSRLGNTVCLVLIAAAEEDEAKRKTGVTVKLDNAVKKIGAVVAFRALKGEGLAGWIANRVKLEGKRIEPAAVEALIQSVGNEMLLLEQELIKLVCFVGDADMIRQRDVAAVVASSPEDVMFATIDAITRRQTDTALSLLAELNRFDPKPQAVAAKLLALLSRQYRMLWQAKFLLEKRVQPRDVRALPPDLASELPTESNIAQVAFKANDIFALARSYRWRDIADALDKLLLCDLANKGGVTDESDIFGSEPGKNLQLLVLELTTSGKPH